MIDFNARRVRIDRWLDSPYGKSFLLEICHVYGKSEKETRGKIMGEMMIHGVVYSGLIEALNSDLLATPFTTRRMRNNE